MQQTRFRTGKTGVTIRRRGEAVKAGEGAEGIVSLGRIAEKMGRGIFTQRREDAKKTEKSIPPRLFFPCSFSTRFFL